MSIERLTEKNFPLHDIDSAPGAAKPAVADAQKAYGFLPNLLGVMAASAPVLEAYRALSGFFERTSFSPTERQVVLLAVSYENGCEYCVAAHSVIAGMQQVPEAVVAAIRSGTPIPDVRLEALRRFTAQVVTTRGWPGDGAVKAFLEAGFDRAQVLEVLLGVGMKTLSNYTNHLAATPLDPAFAGAAWTKAA